MKVLMICWLVCLAALAGRSQPALRMQDLEAAIEKNHPALKMLDAESRSLSEEARGAYNWMAPELGAGFYMTPYDPRYWKVMDGRPGMGSFMVSAQQYFPNRKRQDAEYAYLSARAGIRTGQKEVVVNELLGEARKNYYDWIVLEKKRRILNENAELLRFMLKSAEIRYRNGLGKLGAYYKVQAALSQLENQQVLLESQVEQRRIALNTAMYRNPGEPLAIDTSYSWVEIPQDMLDTAVLRTRRSDIGVLDRTRQVNELERRAQLAGLRPEFGIRYDNMLGWARQPFLFSLMGMVRIPLAHWSSRANRARAESLTWENEAISYQQQTLLQEAAGTARSRVAELEGKKRQLRLYEQQILPALQRNYQTLQLGYEQNTEELPALFDAWDALNQSQLDYLDTLQQALAMQADLMKTLELK
ncbi:MAG TPA: TolC family protein [Chitinophagaceae bacterium]|nr:TolC family protein [Chitinophagaceae bacterium]